MKKILVLVLSLFLFGCPVRHREHWDDEARTRQSLLGQSQKTIKEIYGSPDSVSSYETPRGYRKVWKYNRRGEAGLASEHKDVLVEFEDNSVTNIVFY